MRAIPPYIEDMRLLRVAQQMTQVDLDSRVGVADGYTAKVESLARAPSLNMLCFFAEGLNADVRIIPREDSDMSQGGRKSGSFSKSKGNRIEADIVNKLKAIGVEAERIVLSGAAGRFHSRLEHDVRISDTFQCEVKARADGQGFIQLEQWMGTASMLFLRRDRQEAGVYMPWETFTKLISAFEEKRTGQCPTPTAAVTPSSSTGETTAAPRRRKSSSAETSPSNVSSITASPRASSGGRRSR